MMSDRAPCTFVENDVSRHSRLASRWNVVSPYFRRGGVADEDGGECARVEFSLRRRVVVHIALRTKNAKIADIGLLAPECFVGGFVFEGGSW